MDAPLAPTVPPRAPVAWIAGAWALAVAGLLWASLLSYAGSMRTAPTASLAEALYATPLPLAALALVAKVAGRVRGGAAPWWSLAWLVPPVLAAALALLIGWSLFLQLGMR